MPMPIKDETMAEYMERFMTDPEAMRDYPNIQQRRAIAYQYWLKRNDNE